MRIWQDAHDNLITDEQLVRHIASFGSLSRALEEGDIRLVIATEPQAKPVEEPASTGRRRPHAPLSAWL